MGVMSEYGARLGEESAMRVLVADDDATTRSVLRSCLIKWGYDPLLVEDGVGAWNILRGADAPGLAIIDWMMPKMDGIALLGVLRRTEMPRYVYTLMLTGRQDEDALLEGLAAGADDFIHKPFDAREMRSRLAVGARVVRAEERLRRYAKNMEQLASDRAAQLIHADRLSSLGIMAAGVAHEINNPCTSISSNLQLLDRVWHQLGPVMEQGASFFEEQGVSPDQLTFFRTEMPGIIRNSLGGVKRITKIVESLKQYSRKQGSGLQRCDLNDCIRDALALCAGPLKKHLSIEVRADASLPPFLGDVQQMEQVFINLVVNASDALEGIENATLTISAFTENERICARVEDNGPGIPPNALDQIWTPFYTTKSVGKGTGLGLAICQSIMESFGGTISAHNGPHGGACFVLTLPAASGIMAQDSNACIQESCL